MKLSELKSGDIIVGPSGEKYTVRRVTAVQAVLRSCTRSTINYITPPRKTKPNVEYFTRQLEVDQVALDRFKFLEANP